MSHSLARFRDPAAPPEVLTETLCTLIATIRRVLIHPDLPLHARLAAIETAVDELAPPPDPGICTYAVTGMMPYDIGRAAMVAGWPATIAGILRRGTMPATAVLTELAGTEIVIRLLSRQDRPLTAPERASLQAGGQASGHARAGRLLTRHGGMLVADVECLLIPGRIPARARQDLGIGGPATSVPAGTALGMLGARREPLTADVTPGGDEVTSRARLWLGDVPVGLAAERISAGFCASLPGPLAVPPGQPPAGHGTAARGRRRSAAASTARA